MSDAQKIIAYIATKHPLYYDEYADQFGSAFQCKCGWQPDEETAPDNDHEAVDAAHGQHLAAEIDLALGGLTQEWGVVIDYPPRPEDDYPGAVVILDTYKLREAAEIVKRTKYPEDCYEVRPRWVSGWNQASE